MPWHAASALGSRRPAHISSATLALGPPTLRGRADQRAIDQPTVYDPLRADEHGALVGIEVAVGSIPVPEEVCSAT
jgi:hypothetical protein